MTDICDRCTLPKSTCSRCSFGSTESGGEPVNAVVDVFCGAHIIDVEDTAGNVCISLTATAGNPHLAYAVAELINRGIKSLKKEACPECGSDAPNQKCTAQYGMAVLAGRADLTAWEIVREELDKDFQQFTKGTK